MPDFLAVADEVQLRHLAFERLVELVVGQQRRGRHDGVGLDLDVLARPASSKARPLSVTTMFLAPVMMRTPLAGEPVHGQPQPEVDDALADDVGGLDDGDRAAPLDQELGHFQPCSPAPTTTTFLPMGR